MRLIPLLALCVIPLALSAGQSPPSHTGATPHAPAYTTDGRLLPQPDYREWVYLSSGLDMSYTPRVAGAAGHSMFDNVFVNPEAYRSFLQSGTWPDKTMLVLEVRGAESSVSINKNGHSQGRDLMGLELHVKDAAHGGWSFYEFSRDAPARRIPQAAACYSCHREHAAVDTTFVQFYPTLIPLSEQHHTLSPAFLTELAKPAK